MKLTHLSTSGLPCPLGLHAARPRFSWWVEGDVAETDGYRVQVATDLGFEAVSWDSGEVQGRAVCQATYLGPPLERRRRYYWRARAWAGGVVSPWSEPAWWEMGLLSAADWRARWIAPAWYEDPAAERPAPYLRRAFALDGPVRSARIHATAHGLYAISLNGEAVGDARFAPGFTSYRTRLQVQTYDVGALLRPGENVLGVILADGWYRGRNGVYSARNVYGDRLALLLQLEVELADGRRSMVTSDGAWRATTGPIRQADLKDGESYDARLELDGWDAPGFDDHTWSKVEEVDRGLEQLVGPETYPVRPVEELRPARIFSTPAGQTVVDFGQNLAGVVRLSLCAPAGTEVRLRHGETLDEHGNFSLDHLQAPKIRVVQEDTYTSKGEGVEVFEPRFTFHGFRYVEVTGYPRALELDDLTARALRTDLPWTGTFACSNARLTRLHENIAWSLKSNFLEIPTDCPTRERSGWTGDVQVFARTASYLVDTRTFFSKWLADLAADQRADGMVPGFVPDTRRPFAAKYGNLFHGSAGWGDAAVIVPWTLYEHYGDAAILERQYASMKAWVEYARRSAARLGLVRRFDPRAWLDRDQRLLWDTGFHWGEWQEPDQGESLGDFYLLLLRHATLSVPAVATAYFAYSTRLFALAAEALGRRDDAERYGELAARIRAAYVRAFIGPDGVMRPDKQASYVRALALGLAPDELAPRLVEHLVRKVREAGGHVTTGFLSTGAICQVLADHGRADVAYELLEQETSPSWLSAVERGATTVWETWNGIDEQGRPHLSLNHYSHGAVGAFLYRTVAGIDLGAPGFEEVIVRPRPGGSLTWARARYDSVRGPIAASWRLTDARDLELDVELPPNARATIILPSGRRERRGAGTWRFVEPAPPR